ncbi:hypothetical protein RJ640_003621 [Escallonia rubra]|uniref:Trafficking protein particle complex subunit 8 n=1 Tax=Escallonia rubra TaxID=112253 RepID=A0AA88QP62_9ASTE|nr:hypothetical protein RJ640_003621 [Escallonia rubra]
MAMADQANTPLGRMLLDEITPAVAKERLKQVITFAGENDVSDLYSDPPPIESVLTTSQSECLPSWFRYFNKELVRTVSFSEHEAFDHPVASLVVVSSKDEEPINKFVDLFNTNQLPSLLNDGAMDPKILKHFLLVHDNLDGTPEKALKVLADMRSTFGLNACRLLCLNSFQDGLADHQENLWAPYKSDASPGQRLGCFLSMEDLDELTDIMQDLSSKQIIPHMEQKIRVLNQQVSATRKGFRNQIKNLWWRKGKDDTPENNNGPMYTFSSIESQIRVLGDYAFMLRDYELALSNYRLLSTDYKLDKAWKRYAGVQLLLLWRNQCSVGNRAFINTGKDLMGLCFFDDLEYWEMMGLTYFMLDQSRKDAEYSMENAFTTYLRMGSSGQRNATRCGLWWVEMLKSRDQYKEAASVYCRISGEDPLHSAVMLEQASYCYLLAKPPMLRKYGFHLILSGDLYKKCDQTKHAIRTYRGALSVFKRTTWNRIRDHLHFHIGKWYAFLGMSDVAIKYMLEVLDCSYQSKATQELFLRDFIHIVQKTGKTFEVFRLQLPIVNISSLKIVFEDHRTFASPAAECILTDLLKIQVNVRESLWRSLEEDMIPSLSTTRNNWLDSQPKLMEKKYKESNVCVAGEAIKVDIGFKNPLQVSVTISNVSLICQHSATADEMEPDANSSSSENQNDEVLRKLVSSRELNSDTSSFTLSEVDISLGGGETIVVHARVLDRQLVGKHHLEPAGAVYRVQLRRIVLHVFVFTLPLRVRLGDALEEEEPDLRPADRSPASRSEATLLPCLPQSADPQSRGRESHADADATPAAAAQLTVTPRVEGVLNIVGVMWKLSGSLVGFHSLEPNVTRKKVAKGNRKLKHSKSSNLKFLVIKSLPKLDGVLHHLPKTVYVGDIRRLSLELNNPSEIAVERLKMKISHPRFLNVGNPEDINIVFPACLEKKDSSARSNVKVGTKKILDTVFLFPEDATIHGGTPFVWPLWLRAAAPGHISLYITLYYEMGDLSAVMRYRTLRMHYILEVLPSLDVSFHISTCPSKMEEFRLRMDVANRTKSDSFKVLQLSSVRKEWGISLLQPIETNFPLESLSAGQALSCFFKLKNDRTLAPAEEKVPVLSNVQGTDVRLGSDTSEPVLDTWSSPLIDFHHYERVHQPTDQKKIVPSCCLIFMVVLNSFMHDQRYQDTVDFVLISRRQGDDSSPNSHNIFSHHACHCEITSSSPISWLVDGPRMVHHNFSGSFCEINLRMAIHNSSDSVVSIHINTLDSTPATLSPSGNEAGWHDISLLNDNIKVTSDVLGGGVQKSVSSGSLSPFIWSGSSSTRVKLDAMSTTEVPLLLCVFSPGTYDLSNYVLHWSLLSVNEHGDSGAGSRQSSGTCQGHPFYITVLQQD